MTVRELNLNLWDLISPLAKTVDAMSPEVAEHHMRVAYLSLRICEELTMEPVEKRDVVVAAALHDIGAFSLKDRLDLLEFEEKHATQHSLASYLLLRSFAPFEKIAEIVRYHHQPWNSGSGPSVPRGSHLIHLADRIAVLVDDSRSILSQAKGILDAVGNLRDSVFVPEFVDAFERVAKKDYLWLELVSNRIEGILKKHVPFDEQTFDLDHLELFTRLICRLIDFRSEFTATHSSGVAATAKVLGHWVGFSEQECQMLEITAYLHDLGKLAIPSEIIEKPGKLTLDEWQVMRTHVYYTYRILEPIDALNVITSWGALHQERMDGSGYPFSYKGDELPVGARIMAIADVFTSITEDRPYRKGMDKDEAFMVLETMGERNELDATLVDALLTHFDEVNEIRAEAQQRAIKEYREFRANLMVEGT